MNTLSFVQAGKWSPVRTGNYHDDCVTGRAYADELIKMIGRTGNPALFGSVARAITFGGEFGGVETGFCSRIGIVIAVNASED